VFLELTDEEDKRPQESLFAFQYRDTGSREGRSVGRMLTRLPDPGVIEPRRENELLENLH
jgi:hypothetical protein